MALRPLQFPFLSLHVAVLQGYTKFPSPKFQRIKFGSCTAYLLLLLDSCDFIHSPPLLMIQVKFYSSAFIVYLR
jgi:hypothetical protein